MLPEHYVFNIITIQSKSTTLPDLLFQIEWKINTRY